MPEIAPTFLANGVRLPPQDLATEQALLGALMIKPEGLNEIADLVGSDDFYAEKHRRIFKTMLALQDRGEPIDLVSLTAALKDKKWLASTGGASYLGELAGAMPTASNLNHYAETIRQKAARRRLIASADHIAALGYQEEEELENIFDRAQQVIFNLGQFSKKSILHLKDTLAEAWERFERLHKSESGLRGLSTGFKELDYKLSGLQRADLVIIAARPSVGKTSLALDIVRHVACRENKPVAVFSLEMSSGQLVDRLIAAESHVDAWKLRTGRLTADEEFARIRDALDRLSQAPIFIDDEPLNSIVKMRAITRKLKAERGLEMIVVDYLQLMTPRREADSLVQQVTEISRSLKALGRELEVPVVAISQLNRSVEQRGGRPRLSDLRDSGSIEQDADVVMFIHREDIYDRESDKKNIAEIIIAKHRNGPTGEIKLYFDDTKASFHPIDKSDFGGF